jgi:hypothetical protein
MTTEDITGRDGFIIRQALAYAVEIMSKEPEVLRQDSDRDDMIALLEVMCADNYELEMLQCDARRHVASAFNPEVAHWSKEQLKAHGFLPRFYGENENED